MNRREGDWAMCRHMTAARANGKVNETGMMRNGGNGGQVESRGGEAGVRRVSLSLAGRLGPMLFLPAAPPGGRLKRPGETRTS